MMSPAIFSGQHEASSLLQVAHRPAQRELGSGGHGEKFSIFAFASLTIGLLAPTPLTMRIGHRQLRAT